MKFYNHVLTRKRLMMCCHINPNVTMSIKSSQKTKTSNCVFETDISSSIFAHKFTYQNLCKKKVSQGEYSWTCIDHNYRRNLYCCGTFCDEEASSQGWGFSFLFQMGRNSANIRTSMSTTIIIIPYGSRTNNGM